MKDSTENTSICVKGIHDSKEIISSIKANFQEIAKDIISDNLDISDKQNKDFFDNPDDPNEHKPNWHQWGIITHTEKVIEFYKKEVPRYLELCGVKEKVISHMAEKIDGKTKDELFEIAIMLHDLGKFISRKAKKANDATAGFMFNKHEKASGEIIRGTKFNSKLKEEYGLSDGQIEYIARCAELHYILGKIRKQEKDSSNGYTVDFANGAFFHQKAKEMIDKYKEYALEIGLFFLADSLGKTEIHISTSNNEDSKSQDDAIKQTLLDRGLNLKLFKSVKEIPISVAVAENYLKIWANQCFNQ